MDFTKVLPIELSELIFQYLKTKELLGVTLVSKSWNTFIGESQNLMKNIKIVYDLNHKSSQLLKWKKIIPKSLRIYQNVEFAKIDAKLIKKIFYIFKSKNNQVKRLKFFDVHFNNTEELADFIELFNPTVNEIILDCIEVKKIQKIYCDEMENLRKFKLISYQSLDCINVFLGAKNLLSLEIQAENVTLEKTLNFENIEILVKLLHQNEKLKNFNLSIYMDNQHLENQERISIFPFKLCGFKNSNIDLKNFFVIQIQSLYLDNDDYSDDLATIFKIPKLKEAILSLISRGLIVGLPLLTEEEREEISVLEVSLHFKKFKEYLSNTVLFWLGLV
ncbi:hypothetical protein PVAND_008439 [Polypedilum vanderplanki]|uniref:F-box domain-containing protein n=1 Tax=Polypedilum vanderplanki TaxID=319348 RepID=A0A9J6CA86_POLVA|nr:hypothetical protein PVAND_008439 [Polypedilum vanderplanki]